MSTITTDMIKAKLVAAAKARGVDAKDELAGLWWGRLLLRPWVDHRGDVEVRLVGGYVRGRSWKWGPNDDHDAKIAKVADALAKLNAEAETAEAADRAKRNRQNTLDEQANAINARLGVSGASVAYASAGGGRLRAIASVPGDAAKVEAVLRAVKAALEGMS